ncbi:MAG: S8 family peptidase [Patescibacteria group bacterium]
MKTYRKIIFNSINIAAILSLLLFVGNINFFLAQAKGNDVDEQSLQDSMASHRKIVVFKEGLSDAEKEKVINITGSVKLKNLDLIKSKLVDVPSQTALENLIGHPKVVRIDEDVIVGALAIDLESAFTEKGFRLLNLGVNNEGALLKKLSKLQGSVQASQSLPWGIDRIDAELVWPSGNTANPVKVAIIDTGISMGHPDLKDNIKGGINTINPTRSFNDDNGHGSHVAGIVAALNNSVGVVGAGPSADLYGVKVLNRNGSGFLSDIIEGIEWSVNNNIQVINMSLGTSSNVQSLHDAVIAAKNAGVVVVAAAGNSGGSVLYPAAYPEVIAVSATDSNNNIANWSSRGPEVDIAAPGVSIYSTYKGTSYATLSGTSMASPHVAGTASLVLNTPVLNYDANSNGKWDPDEVQKKLQDTAIDKGVAGFDNLYGWGLVNAYKAVQ